jgi:predicted MFS family arabinose efflux permease
MLAPVGGVRGRLRESAAAFAAVWRNANLRWLELAWASAVVGHYAFLISVSVYAYTVGGEKAVGLVFLVRLIPAALVAPFAGMLGDRYPREKVLLYTNLARVLLVAAAALAVFADADPLVVYTFSIAATIATTPFRSSQAALTPTLARTPEELTAANAVASGIDSIAIFAGPAVAGALLAAASIGTVFTMTAALIAVSALFVLLMSVDREEKPKRELDASTIAAERLAGFTTLARNPSLRVLVLLLTALTGMFGLVQVFIVVAAIELLGLGEGGVGYLNAAIGVGAFVGAVSALTLTGAKRLSPPFLAGLVVAGLPLVALGLWQDVTVALLVFGVMGLGHSWADVAGLTLIQRAVPDEVLARVFGVIQMLFLAAMGIGAAIAPALIALLGTDTAIVVTGLVLPALVAVSGVTVARIDAAAPAPDVDELRVLASVPIFAPLPGGSLEHLAARLVPLRVDPGTVIVREGDAGDRFYIVAEGEIEVTQDGQMISELDAGGYFGEIALLRDIPRTATVTAKTNAVLYALDREDFLSAVTGHAQSAEAAETVMSARLAGPAATGYRSATSS